MTSWKFLRKNLLIQLATELGVETADSDTNKALVRKILEAEDFDEELTVGFAERIKADSERKDKIDEEEREHAFELEKLRISCSAKKRPELKCALTRSRAREEAREIDAQQTSIVSRSLSPQSAPNIEYDPSVELGTEIEEISAPNRTEFLELTRVGSEDFGKAQRECENLEINWEKNLRSALVALRTTTHKSTGFFSSEIDRRRDWRNPLTLLHESWLDPEITDPNVVDCIFENTNRLNEWRGTSESNQKDRQMKRKSGCDREAVNHDFDVSDLIVVLATAKPNKMAINMRGPEKDATKISDINYAVYLPGRKDSLAVYHANLIEPYYEIPKLINFVTDEEFKEIGQEAENSHPASDPDHLDPFEMIDVSGLEGKLSPEQIDKSTEVFLRHRDVVSLEPGLTSLIEIDIGTNGNGPGSPKPYRMSQRQLDSLRRDLDQRLKMGDTFASDPILILHVY